MIFELSALLRTGFACCFLLERYFLSGQLDVLFYPSMGLLPFETGQQHPTIAQNPTMFTIFQWARHSDKLVDIAWQAGVCHGILLLVGIFPRVQLVGILTNLLCFQNHNMMTWKSSDTLFRLYCFLLLFLPVHKYGLTDWILNRHGTSTHNSNENTDGTALRPSWPMWPVRLFQGWLTVIYFSTALSVWGNEDYYPKGDQLFYVRNSDLWNPLFALIDHALADVATARYATYTALALFTTSWWLVWVLPSSGRNLVVATMVCFHLGIETLTNTYFMNTLLALGWLTFLVQPDAKIRPANPTAQIAATTLVVVLALLMSIGGFPLELIAPYPPTKLQGEWNSLVELQYELYNHIKPVLYMFGLWQGLWDISAVHKPHARISFQAFLVFTDNSESIWNSPNFQSMSWLEKKQHGRILNYFANLPTSRATAAAVKLCDAFRGNYGPELAACKLVHYLEFDPLPPANTRGIFVPKEEDMQRYSLVVVDIAYCVDQRNDYEALMTNHNIYGFPGLAGAPSCGKCQPMIEFGSKQGYEYEPYTKSESQTSAKLLFVEDDEDDEGDDNYEGNENGKEHKLGKIGDVVTDEEEIIMSVEANAKYIRSYLYDDKEYDEEYDDEDEYNDKGDQYEYDDAEEHDELLQPNPDSYAAVVDKTHTSPDPACHWRQGQNRTKGNLYCYNNWLRHFG